MTLLPAPVLPAPRSADLTGPTASVLGAPDLSALPAGTVVVHGGMHKTGSSALQAVLAGAGPELREAGWLYPEAGRVVDPETGPRHVWLMAELRDGTSGAPAWARLRRELDAWDGRVLLSHENLLSPEVDPARLVEALGGRPVVLLAWVRHPVDYLESCYREWTRRWGMAVDPRRYAEVRAPYLEVPGLVRAWEEVGAQVVLRPYDRELLAGGSTVDDALALLDLPHLPRATGAANDSLNTRQLLVHRVANRLGVHPREELRDLVSRLLADPGTREAALSGLPTVPSGGWSRRRLVALRALLSVPFPQRARVLDDDLVAEVTARHLAPLQALLVAHGAPQGVLSRSACAAAPFDTTHTDPALEAVAAQLWS